MGGFDWGAANQSSLPLFGLIKGFMGGPSMQARRAYEKNRAQFAVNSAVREKQGFTENQEVERQNLQQNLANRGFGMQSSLVKEPQNLFEHNYMRGLAARTEGVREARAGQLAWRRNDSLQQRLGPLNFVEGELGRIGSMIGLGASMGMFGGGGGGGGMAGSPMMYTPNPYYNQSPYGAPSYGNSMYA